MNGFLRQATASQSRALGPFVSDSDFTPATGLTIGASDIKLIANGAAAADKNSGGGTHRANGKYGVTFDATDTATVGELDVSVKVAGALVFSATFTVVEEAVYDRDFAAAAPGYAAAADDAVLAAIDALPTNAELATALAAADDAVLAVLSGINAKTTNLPSDPADASDIASAFSAVNTKLDTIAGYIDTEVGAIKVKTDALPSDPADASDIAAAFATVNSKLDVIDDFVDTEISAIKAKTDLIPASPAAVGSAMTLTAPAMEAISDTWTGRNIKGGANGGRTNGEAMAANRNRQEIDDEGILTVYDTNDTTPLWTGVATRTPGDPISGIDPA